MEKIPFNSTLIQLEQKNNNVPQGKVYLKLFGFISELLLKRGVISMKQCRQNSNGWSEKVETTGCLINKQISFRQESCQRLRLLVIPVMVMTNNERKTIISETTEGSDDR